MRLDNSLIKILRILLFPFSVLYGIVVSIRNFLYNERILRAHRFDFPVICVGNLSVGGTGKTPMTEYLIRLLKDNYKIVTLSRGYKRKTKGFVWAKEDANVNMIGDEPMQLHLSFPEIKVAVGEDRARAIKHIMYDMPDTEVIILDDAFQHRSVEAGYNILLTAYQSLYTQDCFLPTGNLRDAKTSALRADVVVVTKCPPLLGIQEKESIVQKLALHPSQKVFFTTIEYAPLQPLFNAPSIALDTNMEVVLVTGIAHTTHIEQYIKEQVKQVSLLAYMDHYSFDEKDFDEIIATLKKKKSAQKIIVTTAKDAVKWMPFAHKFKDIPVYILPIKQQFLFDEEQLFNQALIRFIKKFKIK